MLLYIHIPFCESKCNYCAFNSYVGKEKYYKEYFTALNKQLKYELKNKKISEKSIETVFFGGGTPSVIPFYYYENIFKTINFYLKDNAEITSEANPNSASISWLKEMKNFGLNRISFGVQSFDDAKLKVLGRKHSSRDAIEAIKNAYNIGIKNISCDIIYGLKGDDYSKIEKDLKIAFSLPVTHLSAYSLTIEKNTKFYKFKNTITIDDEELSRKIFNFIKNNNFIQYEISNFARNKESFSKHNYGYWQHKEYLGVGAGAVGYYNKERYYPPKTISNYIKDPINYNIEKLSNEDIVMEKVLLGLRSKVGVEMKIFNEIQLKKIEDLLAENKIKIENIKNAKMVYNNNFLLADEIALYLL